MSKWNRRLNKITNEIERLPITQAAEDAALEHFQETGELPDHRALAARTTESALFLPRHRPLREMLFEEAVEDERAVVRFAAREALKLLVSAGQDVTSRGFLDEGMDLPEFGSIGLHLLGWPECLVKPPYEDQARRMLKRLDSVRRRVPEGDQGWFRRFARAAATFFRTGDLPHKEDSFMREAVLVYGEFFALGRNLGGEADAEVLAAFDNHYAARGREGKKLDAAIEQLQSLAAEGRIP